MQKSESITELAKALAKAQGMMAAAKKSSDNPFFHSKYAALDAVFDAIREPLASNGIAITQLVQPDTEIAHVETVLMHESGEWISSTIKLKPVKSDPQGMGSAITYARRYGLSPIVGVATEEDDDGEKAMGRTEKKEPSKAKPPTKKESSYHKEPQADEDQKLTSFWGNLNKLGWTSKQVYEKLGINSLKEDWLEKGKTLREAYDLVIKKDDVLPKQTHCAKCGQEAKLSESNGMMVCEKCF